MRYPGLLLLLLVLPPVTPATADDHLFTQLEQQQISIATPGLFDRSLAFTIDFSHLKEGSYSFPLPIGKARQLKDNYVEISSMNGETIESLTLVDMNGRIIRQEKAGSPVAILVTNDLPRGIYAVTVHTNMSMKTIKIKMR